MELGKDMYALFLGPIFVVEHSISQLVILVNVSPVKCSWSQFQIGIGGLQLENSVAV